MAIDTRQSPPNNIVPNRPVPSFPTPVISDQIYTEVVSTETGSYAPLEYGTLFDTVPHTSFNGSKPGFALVFQAPVDPNGYWVRRTWANNRTDQDSYNYSISYEQSNPDYPTITRVYVLPREGYTPLAPLTPDPDFPQAKLVEEQMMNQVEPQELNSLYVKVARTYQTVPGPITTTQDFDTQINTLVYTDKQIVLATDIFDTTSPASNLLTLDMKESPLTQYTKARATSYLQSLPPSFTQYRSGRYNFPALVFDITLDTYQWTLDPDRSQVYWYPTMRGEPNVPALFKVTTSYFTSEPSTETLFVIPSANLYYNGTSYNISLQNVLNDAISVDVDFVDDAQYGDLGEPHTFSATSLTATAYTALIGTYQKVACDITRWRGSVWVKVVQEVLIV